MTPQWLSLDAINSQYGLHPAIFDWLDRIGKDPLRDVQTRTHRGKVLYAVTDDVDLGLRAARASLIAGWTPALRTLPLQRAFLFLCISEGAAVNAAKILYHWNWLPRAHYPVGLLEQYWTTLLGHVSADTRAWLEHGEGAPDALTERVLHLLDLWAPLMEDGLLIHDKLRIPKRERMLIDAVLCLDTTDAVRVDMLQRNYRYTVTTEFLQMYRTYMFDTDSALPADIAFWAARQGRLYHAHVYPALRCKTPEEYARALKLDLKQTAREYLNDVGRAAYKNAVLPVSGAQDLRRRTQALTTIARVANIMHDDDVGAATGQTDHADLDLLRLEHDPTPVDAMLTVNELTKEDRNGIVNGAIRTPKLDKTG